MEPTEPTLTMTLNEEGVSEEFSVLLMKEKTRKKTGEWLIWHSVL